MDYSYLHEVEAIEFRAKKPRPRSELLGVFLSQGFNLHDDLVSLDRTGKVPPWQHSSIVEVEVQLHGNEVFGFEDGDWDKVILKYLFASLPITCAKAFIRVVNLTGEKLGIIPVYKGNEFDQDFLEGEFKRVQEDLISETGEEPGSEGLAILIQSTYPRS